MVSEVRFGRVDMRAVLGYEGLEGNLETRSSHVILGTWKHQWKYGLVIYQCVLTVESVS